MKYFLIFCTLICFTSAQAQQSKNYKKHPYWIEMIKDPNVNYFEAINAYETFWKGKRKPLEEDELIGQTKGEASKEKRWTAAARCAKKEKKKKCIKNMV